MMVNTKQSSKLERSLDKDSERKSKKRRKHDQDGRKHKHRRKDSDKLHIVDDDPNDDDMWVEKNIDMDGERVLATNIPTAESLKLTSSAVADPPGPELPPNRSTETPLKRDDWMLLPPTVPTVPADSGKHIQVTESLTDDYGEASGGRSTLGGGVDFFTSLGTDMKRKPRQERPNVDQRVISSREINLDLAKDTNTDEIPPASKAIPGGPGFRWRMMRLTRVYETAEEEGVEVENIALERFGSLEAFEEAKEERRIIDEREGRRSERGRATDRQDLIRVKDADGEKRLMFTDIGGSGGSSRSSSFRRPGGIGGSAPSTPSPAPDARVPQNRRLDSLRVQSGARSPLVHSHTPIPTVMTPPPGAGSRSRALSPSSLNKLQAKVLRAKLTGAPNADQLEREYEAASKAASGEGVQSGVRTKTEVLPTLDGRGRLYDIGQGKDDGQVLPGNRKKQDKFETRDPKTGDIIRYNADDDDTTLGEMLRQERFGAGMADQKNLDAQFAQAIMGDGKFENDLDYMDDNAERLGRQKMRADAMKRQFAIHDYKRTQKVLATCHLCFGEDDSPPKAPIIAMGTRVYLSCTTNEELVEGHCLIVPIQHHLTMLEGDDDVWDEVRNFMKCLMRMYAEEDKGVIFYETVISLKWQKHTCIECVPLPWAQYEDIPAYFKESILASEAEWSQHKKLIDLSARPGGFRRAMVPNLPYFMVQFDHKGERGYGHVIEGSGKRDDEDVTDEGEKGGGDFPIYFAGEIIGNVLELEPRRWRRPRRIDFRSNRDRVAQFRKSYDKFDWTGMIGRD